MHNNFGGWEAQEKMHTVTKKKKREILTVLKKVFNKLTEKEWEKIC